MVTLPSWAIASSSSYFSRHYRTDLEMMSLAIHLSDRNISEGTGGPFGAAIFERHPSKGYCTLVSIGMNRVVPLGTSVERQLGCVAWPQGQGAAIRWLSL